jgi:Ca2+/H+ antiporter
MKVEKKAARRFLYSIVPGFGPEGRDENGPTARLLENRHGIGVSLMTMQLVISVGSSFVQKLVEQTGNSGDIGQLATVMVGVIILAVIAHQLPKIMAAWKGRMDHSREKAVF